MTNHDSFPFSFRAWHSDLPVETSKDCISLCDEEKEIEVDPSYPLLLNHWLQDALESFFRLSFEIDASN